MSWWESPTVLKLFLIKSWTAEHIYMCVRGCRCQGWLMSRPVGILVTLHRPGDTGVQSGRRRGELNEIFLRDPNRGQQGPRSCLISPAWEDDASLQSHCQRGVEENMNAPSKVKRRQEIDWETTREWNKGRRREKLTHELRPSVSCSSCLWMNQFIQCAKPESESYFHYGFSS